MTNLFQIAVVFSIVGLVHSLCLFPEEWEGTWSLTSTQRWVVMRSVVRIYTGSETVDWRCEDHLGAGSGNWDYVLLSSSTTQLYCYRVYQQSNYLLYWRASVPHSGLRDANACQSSYLYNSTSPDILITDAGLDPEVCFRTIPGAYTAQVSLSDTQTDLCNIDTSQAIFTATNIELRTCVRTGFLTCLGTLEAKYLDDLAGNTIVLLRNASDPSRQHCARLLNDRAQQRVFLSVEFTPRDRMYCDRGATPTTAIDTPTKQITAFSLKRVFCEPFSPCENGATCREDPVYDFRCLCQPGYNGLYCNHQIMCYSSPCMNGGTCLEEPGHFHCICPVGYTGDRCESEFQCASSPCASGRCLGDANNFICICDDFVAGTLCEKAACEAGTHLDQDYPDLCLICPRGTYQSLNLADECESCGPGWTTPGEQSTSQQECIQNCAPGHRVVNYPSLPWHQRACEPCPPGTYQPERGQVACLECPQGSITTQTGSTTIKQCVVVNPCESNPCASGATCLADVTGYNCACPDFRGGQLCQRDTVPRVLSVSPLFGPLAGGTRITLTGTDLQGHSTPVITLGDRSATVVSRTSTQIVVEAPTHDVSSSTTFSSESLDMSFTYAPGHEVSLGGQTEFTYLPNPEVNEVTGLATIAKGGSSVTGLGVHIDSVARPILLISLVYKEVYRTQPLTATLITKRYTTPCESPNSTAVTCVVPELVLPAHINGTLVASSGRVRRSSGDMELRVFKGCDQLKLAPNEVEFYVAFALDGVVDSGEDRELCVFEDPQLAEFEPPVQKYEEGQRLVIKGDNVDVGLTPLHYHISVVTEQCVQVDLFSNGLNCQHSNTSIIYFYLNDGCFFFYSGSERRHSCTNMLGSGQCNVSDNVDVGLTPLHYHISVGTEQCMQVDLFSNTLSCQHSNTSIIYFYGDNVDVGLTPLHYHISVGAESCGELELLSNALSCQPPRSFPDQDSSAGTDQRYKNAATVIIRLGENYRFHAGYLQYPSFPSLAVPIGAACGGFLLLIVVIVTILCCRHRRISPKLPATLPEDSAMPKVSSPNPLYTTTPTAYTAPDVTSNGNGITHTLTSKRNNSIYDVTASTQVRLPSSSSDGSTECEAGYRCGFGSLGHNGLVNGHTAAMLRKFSAPEASSRDGEVQLRSATKRRNTTWREIRETGNSRRFMRGDSSRTLGEETPAGVAPDTRGIPRETERSRRFTRNNYSTVFTTNGALPGGGGGGDANGDAPGLGEGVRHTGVSQNKPGSRKSRRFRREDSVPCNITESGTTKRFTRSGSVECDRNEPDYVRQICLVDGNAAAVTGIDSLRVQLNGRASAPYTVT